MGAGARPAVPTLPGAPQWYPLPGRDARTIRLQCPKCGRRFPLGPSIAGDPMRFRMSGLLEPRPDVARADEGVDGSTGHQPGAVPVLLTLLFLSEWLPDIRGAAVFETSYELRGDAISACETDLVVIAYGSRPRPYTHIFVGECKGQGVVTENDVRKLGAIVERLRESGVESDLIFSTTRSAFTEDELTLFRNYHAKSSDWAPLRRAPLLLTANELDFHRHSEKSRVSREIDRTYSGAMHDNLVTRSTRKLVGDQAQQA
jgi:hypothetical protein